MKLNVVNRLVAGFSLIAVLMLVISISAVLYLNKIQSATTQVNEQSVPILSISKDLQVHFLSMSKDTFEGFVKKDVEDIEATKLSFEASRDAFNRSFAQLKLLTEDEQNLRATLGSIGASYTQYMQNVEQMFTNHQTHVLLSIQSNDIAAELEGLADEASMLAFDFFDENEASTNPNIQNAVLISAQLEASFINMIAYLQEFITTESLLNANNVSQEFGKLLESSQSKIDSMGRELEATNNNAIVGELATLLTDIRASVEGQSGLVSVKKSSLNKSSEAALNMQASEKKMALSIKEINNLIADVNTNVSNAKNTVSSTVSLATMLIVSITIIALAVAVFISVNTVNAITKPLAKINTVLNDIAAGDLTQRLDDSSSNEFGVLSRNVNSVVANLKQVILGIGQRADRLSVAAEQTSAVTSQTTISIDEQKSQIAVVADATSKMQSRATGVKQNAEETLSQIQQADSEAAKIKTISLENKRTIETLAVDVDAAAEVINKLHQDSTSISGILDVIRGVADQTNLLALNAAIEAARAGEQGRGFAVVADEVRTLASRTQQSTQEINAMIEVLQEGAERAVSVMNQGKAQTDICVEQTMKATQAVDSITDAVHRAHDVSSRIEESARTNSEVSRDISFKLESIVGIAQETSVGALQTSESSKSVADLAEELQSSIQQFKV